MSLLPVKSPERAVLCRDHLDIVAQERNTTENGIIAKRGKSETKYGRHYC